METNTTAECKSTTKAAKQDLCSCGEPTIGQWKTIMEAIGQAEVTCFREETNYLAIYDYNKGNDGSCVFFCRNKLLSNLRL